MKFIIENISTIVVGALLAAILLGVILSMMRAKRTGKSCCGCNCQSCPMGSSCHKP